MRYHQINEHVVNLLTVEQKSQYIDVVWDMMVASYESIGGFHTADSKEDLIAKTGLWKLVRRDGKIVSAFLYKDQFGRKSIASATDKSEQGLKDFNKIKTDDIKLKRAWAEVSGTPEVMLRRMRAKPVPNRLAGILTGKEIIDLADDGFHYTRMIGGEPMEKVIYGFVDLNRAEIAALTANGVEVEVMPEKVTDDALT